MKAVLLAPMPPPAGSVVSWKAQMLSSPPDDDWQIDLVDTKVIGGVKFTVQVREDGFGIR